MPDLSDDTNADSASLVPTVLQHLPDLFKNHTLAATVFRTVRKASRSQRSLLVITPLLTPLTSIALTATDLKISDDAALTCISILHALATQRVKRAVAAYVRDLLTIASLLIERDDSSPVTCVLAAFMAAIAPRNGSAGAISPVGSVQVPPVPVSPQSLAALLHLIGFMIPPCSVLHLRTDPEQNCTPHLTASEHEDSVTSMRISCKFWVSLGVATRSSVLNLASSHVILSGKCGLGPALEAANVMERALDTTSGCVVPITIRKRVSAAAQAILVAYSEQDSKEGNVSASIRLALYNICVLTSSSKRIDSSVWISSGVHDAVSRNDEVAVMLRAMSRQGFMSSKSAERGVHITPSNSSPHTCRPRKRRRKSDGLEAFRFTREPHDAPCLSSLGTLQAPYNEPYICLTVCLSRELAILENVSGFAENPSSMQSLAIIVALTNDALKAVQDDISDSRTQMKNLISFAACIGDTVRDVYEKAEPNLPQDLCSPLLFLAVECVKMFASLYELEILLSSINQVISNNVESVRRIAADSFLCFVVNVLDVATSRLQSSEVAIPVNDLSALFWEIGESSLLHKLNSSQHDSITKSSRRLHQFMLCESSKLSFSSQAILVKSLFHIRISAESAELESTTSSILQKLQTLSVKHKFSNPDLSAGSLQAIRDCVCTMARCSRNHNRKAESANDVAQPGSLNSDVWNTIFADASLLMKGTGADEVITAATACVGALVLHAPPCSAGEAAAAFLQNLWHPTCSEARLKVMDMLPCIYARQGLEIRKRTMNLERNSCIGRVIARDQHDSWDKLEMLLTLTEEKGHVARLLGTELQHRILHNTSEDPVREYDSLQRVDIAALAMIARLDANEVVMKKVVSNAIEILLSASIVELLTWSEEQPHGENPDARPALPFKAWSRLLAHAWNTTVHRSTKKWSLRRSEIFLQDRTQHNSDQGIVQGRSPPALSVAALLSSRFEDWISIAVDRMEANELYVQQLTQVLALPAVEVLWKKACRYVVGPMLRTRDNLKLSALASRVKKPVGEVVESACAEALARLLLMDPKSFVTLQHNSLTFMSTLFSLHPKVLIEQRSGKIVQRIVMEVGGKYEHHVEDALASLGETLGIKIRTDAPSPSVASVLVSRHFMLVMDAVSRGLFRSRASCTTRIRYLRILSAALKVASECLHLHIPKVLAILKMSLDTSSKKATLREETIRAWATFLGTVGTRPIMPHWGSVLATLLPIIPYYRSILSSLLSRVTEEGIKSQESNQTFHSANDWSEIKLLLSISGDVKLAEVSRRITCGNQRNDEKSVDCDMNSDGEMSDPGGLLELSNVIAKIVSRYGNGVVEVAVVDHLLNELRKFRTLLEEIRVCHIRTCTASQNSRIGSIAKILRVLIASITRTSSTECQDKLVECIGELGALDPAIVAQYDPSNSKDQGATVVSEQSQIYPEKIQPLVALLLNKYLIPALGQGEVRSGSNSLLNRIGLVIQELLRVCGCKKDTAVRASKGNETRVATNSSVDWDNVLVGESSQENAIFFWENLDYSTKSSAQPYLAEPFDVQYYKEVFGGNSAGDLTTARQPVWAKVKAASSPGVLPTAREWRRQLVVQLVDYIGTQGTYGATLKAVRPILRYVDSIAALIFPLAVCSALDVQRQKGGEELQQFLSQEVAAVLNGCVAPQIVFELLDILRCWREQRSITQGRKRSAAMNKHGIGSGTDKSSDVVRVRVSSTATIEKERVNDPLCPLVDLYGRESHRMSLLVQAKSALRARSFVRTVLLAECHIRNLRERRNFGAWPLFMEKLKGNGGQRRPKNGSEEADALQVLQKAFAGLEDSHSMTGVSLLRGGATLSDSIVDAESSSRLDEALVAYERALGENPRDSGLNSGFLRCLMTLGHWETMLSHAEGLVSSSKLDEMQLRYSTQTLAIDAAWRLGRWEKVEEFGHLELDTEDEFAQTERPWPLEFNICFGKMLAHLHRGQGDMTGNFAHVARRRLLPPLTRLAREGYARAYPVIVLLHSVSDVEDASRISQGKPGDREKILPHGGRHIRSPEHNPPLISLQSRIACAASSLAVQEPLLSAGRVCFESLGKSSDAAKADLQLACLAQAGGNLRAASAYAFSASTVAHFDSEVAHAVTMQLARIRRALGDSTSALETVRGEIGELKSRRATLSVGSPSSQLLAAVDDQLCAAHIMAGSWIEETRIESSDAILSYLEEATLFGPSREEPFYALGRHYDNLLQANGSLTSNITSCADAGSSRSSRRLTGVMTSVKNSTQSYRYVPLIIKNFTQALCNGHTRIFEALPRMLTIWFDFHSAMNSSEPSPITGSAESDVRHEMKRAFTNVPPYMWMTAVSQLMSRVLHPRKLVRDELLQLLALVVYSYPDQAMWMVLPSAILKSEERKAAANDILKAAVQLGKKSKLSHHQFQRHEDPRRLRMRFHATLSIVRCFVDICNTMLNRDKRGRLEDCSREFAPLKKALQISATNPIVPTLESLTVRLPTSMQESLRPFSDQPCRIVDIEDHALVMSSLMRPRRISLIGSDGRQYRYLAKRETAGDMRKDSRLVEFITVVNRLLSKDSASRQRGLELKTYAVLPLTEETGMIQWVNDLDPMRKLVREQHLKLADVPQTTAVQAKHQKTADHRRFLEWAISKFPPVLDRFFIQQFGNGTDPRAWLDARTLWTKSVAVWSIAGYVVGLGDRHGENVLVETTTGRCVHVDFAMLFDKGKTLKVPEIVPFRLTPNMVVAMGVAGYEGVFRTVAEKVIEILRSNSDALLGVLETFLHDPLADWGKSDVRGANGTITATKEAWQTRAAVKAKLSGIMDGSGLPFSVKGQMQRLIQEATSVENLSKMYVWWSGWV